MTKQFHITATLILDELSWPNGDTAAQDWMLNDIILGDDLRIISPEIGDVIGVLLVDSVECACPCQATAGADR